MWTPPTLAGGKLDVSQRPMLDMLVPYQDRMVVVRGVDNGTQPLYRPGNGHVGPGHTYLTAHLPRTAVDDAGNYLPLASQATVQIGTACVGPSIDHYLASKLGGPDSLHLAVNEPSGGEYHPFYKTTKNADGSNVRADMVVDPTVVFQQFVSMTAPLQPTRLQRYRQKRASVLDAVRGALKDLTAKVGRDDQIRLQEHAQRIADLERTLTTLPPVQCQGAKQVLPADFPPKNHWGSGSRVYEDVLSNAQIENLVQMLACGARNVATITHDNYDSPLFPWLASEADVPVADRVNFPVDGINWHARVHRDKGSPANHPILVHGFRFYGKQFKYLLDRMSSVVEPNGKTLLDNSLVLWISEFGDGGGHQTTNLPIVLAGGLQGALRGGRFIDVSGSSTRYTTADLHTSILKLFGIDERFGFAQTNHGGLPGLAG
jgi:hypothetical protein